MHVCGDVGDVLKDILKFSVQIIDCEFAGIPNNILSLEQEYNGSKKIGFGCIDTKLEYVDELDHVVKLIKKRHRYYWRRKHDGRSRLWYENALKRCSSPQT